MSVEEGRMEISVTCCDGVVVKFSEEEAVQSQILKGAIEAAKAQNQTSSSVRPTTTVSGMIPGISSHILRMVAKYCSLHCASRPIHEELVKDANTFDDGIADLSLLTLLQLIQAAHDLNITDLMDLTCRQLADRVETNTPEKMEDILTLAAKCKAMNEEGLQLVMKMVATEIENPTTFTPQSVE